MACASLLDLADPRASPRITPIPSSSSNPTPLTPSPPSPPSPSLSLDTDEAATRKRLECMAQRMVQLSCDSFRKAVVRGRATALVFQTHGGVTEDLAHFARQRVGERHEALLGLERQRTVQTSVRDCDDNDVCERDRERDLNRKRERERERDDDDDDDDDSDDDASRRSRRRFRSNSPVCGGAHENARDERHAIDSDDTARNDDDDDDDDDEDENRALAPVPSSRDRARWRRPCGPLFSRDDNHVPRSETVAPRPPFGDEQGRSPTSALTALTALTAPTIVTSVPERLGALVVDDLQFRNVYHFLQFHVRLRLNTVAASGLEVPFEVRRMFSPHHAQRGWRFITHAEADAHGLADYEVNPLNGLRGCLVDREGNLVLSSRTVRNSPLVPLLDRVRVLLHGNVDVFSTIASRPFWEAVVRCRHVAPSALLEFQGNAESSALQVTLRSHEAAIATATTAAEAATAAVAAEDATSPLELDARETLRCLVCDPGTAGRARFEGSLGFVARVEALLNEYRGAGLVSFQSSRLRSVPTPTATTALARVDSKCASSSD